MLTKQKNNINNNDPLIKQLTIFKLKLYELN